MLICSKQCWTREIPVRLGCSTKTTTVLRSREKCQSKTSSSDASAGLFSQSTNDGNGGKITVKKIDQKLTQLAEIVNSFAPVIKELKSAYDAAQQQAEADMSEGEINDEESPEHETNDAVSNALTSKSNEIHDLVKDVTENETTAAGLPDKMAAVLESILASGLNEQALHKRKKKIHRPANCKLLQVTKVNSEIRDVAQKATRSMDARLQKLQEALVKGLSPIARLAGIIGESLGKPTAERIMI